LGKGLFFGSYPEIVTNPGDAKELIKLIASSYLYRDIHALDMINNASLFERILKALALQIGSEVSYSELSRLLGADKNTIEKYLWVLEQAFVIFKLPAYSGNLRTEIRKGKKFYFYDKRHQERGDWKLQSAFCAYRCWPALGELCGE